jgi:glutamine amidotransferase
VTQPVLTILNLNIGNLGSIPNMLDRLSCKAVITSDPEVVREARALILPGVGAFDAAIEKLEVAGLREVLNKKVLTEKVPILGICLGMHLMAQASEEGHTQGLGWIPANIVKFQSQPGIKIPHMGWNTVALNPEIPLLQGFTSDPRFYFVHSYHLDPGCSAPDLKMAMTHHGVNFPAVISRGNIQGAQFHPEKSHRFGLQLLHNFVRFAYQKPAQAQEVTPVC